MRGADITQEALFTTVHLESFVPKNHPLRSIRSLFNEALRRIDWLLCGAYSERGRESIPPERLLRAQLLQVLYTIRSERQLMEQMSYNLLFRWFVGLTVDDVVWNHSTFSKNRDRLLEHDVIPALFEEVVAIARKRNLLSEEHFSVDGTLIQAWASQKSFRPKDEDDSDSTGGGRNQEVDFHGEKRLNDTHESKTDPDARSFKKSKGSEAKLAYLGHTLMENRNGLMVKARTSLATGRGERDTAVDLLAELPGSRRKTIGADKNYDTREFVDSCRGMNVTPHVARNDKRRGGSAIDSRTSRHEGYAASMKVRKRIEEGFGWGKTVGLIRQIKVRGLARVNAVFNMTFIGWNLTRMVNLQGGSA
ncbi:IS5 family transposase [Microbulbifer discodermiae]|uniref:IS5 family transposase n=1 Tax=Microbulbifer sp. 2201CG32-9 TaxID=3232309 RepID=UPI00345BD46A